MDWLSGARAILEPAFSFLDSLPIIRAVLGFILVFFLPGFAWTLVFFSGKQINILERLALSFGLSIAVVTLSILALNRLIGMRITWFNAVLVIIAVTIIPVVIYFLKKLITKQRHNTT